MGLKRYIKKGKEIKQELEKYKRSEKLEGLKIELFCPNCKKKVKVERFDIEITYNCFIIKKICEYCNHKIKMVYDQEEIKDLMNNGSE